MVIRSLRLLLICLGCLASFNGSAQRIQPNVIFILTDDQGYGDLACHGNPYIKTPYLDQLNSESVSFTNYHVETTCAPSRAGLMSGQNNNKMGAWHTIKGREILSKEVPTLADKFKDNGYATAIFGKWHLGDSYPYRPQDRGFTEALVIKGGGIGQSPDYWNNDYYSDTYFHNGKPEKFDGYCTDVWFNEAIKFIKAKKDKPFFCYLSLNAPHGPYYVPEAYSKPYKGNSNIANPNFYGMITNIDENIGKLRANLKQMGIDDNTILVFMTDNGSAAGASFNKDGSLKAGYNSGMRGMKGSPYEGGHRVPFFINWPAGGINQHVEINNITGYADFMPTILDLCKIPVNNNDFDGISLAPLIMKNDAGAWPKRTLIVDTQREEFLIKNKDASIMTDQWRMIRQGDKTELYDIVKDPGQTTNIAAKNPNVVQTLSQDYENWWAKISVNSNKYNSYVVGTKNEKVVDISSHDAHSIAGIPAWHQEMVRKGINESSGEYIIEVGNKGTYTIQLRRWPRESGLKINEAAPAGETNDGGGAYLPGVVLNYRSAKLKVDDEKMNTKNVNDGDDNVNFKVKLTKGLHRLTTTFVDDKGVENNAYFITIKKG